MPRYVSTANCTPEQPSPGWYYWRQDEDGNEELLGPFITRHEALDDESDGAYSEWQVAKAEENYVRDVIDSGRGHLLKRDDQ